MRIQQFPTSVLNLRLLQVLNLIGEYTIGNQHDCNWDIRIMLITVQMVAEKIQKEKKREDNKNFPVLFSAALVSKK